MKDGRHLRFRDLRVIYLLIGSCCELGNDPVAWHHRMAEGLNEMMHCRIGVSGMTACQDLHDVGFSLPTNLGVYDWGWSNVDQRQSFIDYCNANMPATDPTLLAIAKIPGRVICRRRCDLVEDEPWQASPHYQNYFRQWKIGDFLYSLSYPPPETGVLMHWINLGRDAAEPGFSVRERRMMTLFASEIHKELGNRLVPFGCSRVPHLSPRLLQVLELLLQAQSEKQIALSMGISRHTIHDYIKELYKRFHVTSRSELLTKWHSLSASNG